MAYHVENQIGMDTIVEWKTWLRLDGPRRQAAFCRVVRINSVLQLTMGFSLMRSNCFGVLDMKEMVQNGGMWWVILTKFITKHWICCNGWQFPLDFPACQRRGFLKSVSSNLTYEWARIFLKKRCLLNIQCAFFRWVARYKRILPAFTFIPPPAVNWPLPLHAFLHWPASIRWFSRRILSMSSPFIQTTSEGSRYRHSTQQPTSFYQPSIMSSRQMTQPIGHVEGFDVSVSIFVLVSSISISWPLWTIGECETFIHLRRTSVRRIHQLFRWIRSAILRDVRSTCSHPLCWRFATRGLEVARPALQSYLRRFLIVLYSCHSL